MVESASIEGKKIQFHRYSTAFVDFTEVRKVLMVIEEFREILHRLPG
jgi:hypothetical protein